MEALLGLARVASEVCHAEGPEEALWCITRAAPALLGDPAAARAPNAFRETAPDGPAVKVTGAAVAFMRTPDGRHHMITAPVNFLPGQYHELVDIRLGHPGEVARTQQPMLLRDTTLHSGFVKILQTFRAGSSMFAPLTWHGKYLGVLICANAARNTFGEADLLAHRTLAALAAAAWLAQGGPAWMQGLDYAALPVRSTAT